MTDAYTRLAVATGDTPPISPQPMPGRPSRASSWLDWLNSIVQPLAPRKIAGAIAGAAAGAGAIAGGGGAKDAGEAARKAIENPFGAPAEMAKAAVGLPTAEWATQWAQKQGRVIGIYLLFVVLGVVGLVFLLSAARGGRK